MVNVLTCAECTRWPSIGLSILTASKFTLVWIWLKGHHQLYILFLWAEKYLQAVLWSDNTANQPTSWRIQMVRPDWNKCHQYSASRQVSTRWYLNWTLGGESDLKLNMVEKGRRKSQTWYQKSVNCQQIKTFLCEMKQGVLKSRFLLSHRASSLWSH